MPPPAAFLMMNDIKPLELKFKKNQIWEKNLLFAAFLFYLLYEREKKTFSLSRYYQP